MTVKPKTVIVVGFVILLCGIAIAYAFMKLKAPVVENMSVVNTEEVREVQQDDTLPQVTFSFAPADSLMVESGGNTEIRVRIETTAELNGVDLYINVDDDVFSVTGARFGDFFTDPIEFSALKKVSEGLYVYSVGSLGKPASGTGIVVVFTLRAMSPSSSGRVGVSPKTIVSVRGGGTTNIILPTPLQYSIVEEIQ